MGNVVEYFGWCSGEGRVEEATLKIKNGEGQGTGGEQTYVYSSPTKRPQLTFQNGVGRRRSDRRRDPSSGAGGDSQIVGGSCDDWAGGVIGEMETDGMRIIWLVAASG
ncbi:hypothetical protein H6P81_001666 [Aristolochia fimbriata]|uniref:Uncharacterized protein n=1 Tax=Aristolochia fimbriata TaxID=158543 RepID=A0AAV7FC34_ARIFI|nr:hypothetical protein H6P81_001666 [Aristolochia fimbriata]